MQTLLSWDLVRFSCHDAADLLIWDESFISVRYRTRSDLGLPSLSCWHLPRAPFMGLCNELQWIWPIHVPVIPPRQVYSHQMCVFLITGTVHHQAVLQKWLCHLLQGFLQLLLHNTNRPLSISLNCLQWMRRYMLQRQSLLVLEKR